MSRVAMICSNPTPTNHNTLINWLHFISISQHFCHIIWLTILALVHLLRPIHFKFEGIENDQTTMFGAYENIWIFFNGKYII
jgi:hypothetical protein